MIKIVIACMLILIVAYIIIQYNTTKLHSYSETPIIIRDFIHKKDIEYIKKNSIHFEKSTTIIDKDGEEDKNRKSYTCWLNHDTTIKRIIQKGCKITNSPLENCEKLQVVKYEPGGFYREHYDTSYATDENGLEFVKNGGHRTLTIIITLSNPNDYEGGETLFTKLNKKYKLNMGDALLFYNVKPNGEQNYYSEHGGLPLLSGEKWIANIWIRQNKFAL